MRNHLFSTLLAAVPLALIASLARAGEPVPLPEPGVLELAGIGAAVAIAIALRRRKK